MEGENNCQLEENALLATTTKKMYESMFKCAIYVKLLKATDKKLDFILHCQFLKPYGEICQWIGHPITQRGMDSIFVMVD